MFRVKITQNLQSNFLPRSGGRFLVIIYIIYRKLSFSSLLFSPNSGEWNGFNQLSFRLVQGAWCLAAFVLFNAYCSTLISYLISPRLMPMAKTYEDVASGYPQKLKLLAEKNEVYTDSYLVGLNL